MLLAALPELRELAGQLSTISCCIWQVRELIYREILEYHPHMLAEYLAGNRQQGNFMYPSAVDNFKRQFAHLEGGGVAGRVGHQNLGQVRSFASVA